jgi:hypothetical protein
MHAKIRMESYRAIWIAPVLALVAFLPATASEANEDSSAETHEHAEHERNEIGVFLGVTTGGEAVQGANEDTTATIGIEYRRNLSSIVGLGFLAEYSGGERRNFVGMLPASFMLGSHAQVIVGAGWEQSSGHSGSGHEFVGRVGFGYSIGLVPGNTIRPEINVDFVDGEELVVVGATIGWGF